MFCVNSCYSDKGEPVCLVQMLPPTPNILVEFMGAEPAEGWLYLAKSLFFFFLVSFSSLTLSFILLVSEFTLNLIDQILQYNSYYTVCSFTPTTLCFYIFMVTQFSLIISVGHFHFISLKKPLCLLAVSSHFSLRWQPPIHFLFPGYVPILDIVYEWELFSDFFHLA